MWTLLWTSLKIMFTEKDFEGNEISESFCVFAFLYQGLSRRDVSVGQKLTNPVEAEVYNESNL